MSLITCKDCQAEISDSADACPRCGAKVLRRNWAPVIWLGLPALALVSWLSFATRAPEYEHEARAARSNCESMFARGAVATMYECTQLYNNMMAKGRASAKPQ